ncbi:hypothetical protein Clacol_005600 [Clathrus columnatus]|uniref:Uncharacterized protein n=1 Tax=Clathrus columnatus TaxID=1419009 RepID=A0AAV5AFE1_9AGAM|nr:hypothetical protein Clacol_005600 [Clathrus columnatus]
MNSQGIADLTSYADQPNAFQSVHSPQTEAESLSIDKHELSEFVINECAMKWPNIADFQKASNDGTINAVKARINNLKAEQRSQIFRAVKYLKAKEHAWLEDFYTAYEGLEPWAPPLNISEFKNFYGMNSRLDVHKTNDFLLHLRHMHIKALTPLYRKLREMQAAEDQAKFRRAKLFPKSTQAWREMDTKDAKLAVARFLSLDNKQQEEHLNRNSTWKESKADVDHLRHEYYTDIVFECEVKQFVKDNETSDPRLKKTQQ